MLDIKITDGERFEALIAGNTLQYRLPYSCRDAGYRYSNKKNVLEVYFYEDRVGASAPDDLLRPKRNILSVPSQCTEVVFKRLRIGKSPYKQRPYFHTERD